MPTVSYKKTHLTQMNLTKVLYQISKLVYSNVFRI